MIRLTKPKTNFYNVNYDKTFVENLHDCIKENGYKFGRDYIEVDLGEYIAFCPFNFSILYSFRGCFPHCVTFAKEHWDNYFKKFFFGWGDLKTFFFKKSTFLREKEDDPMWEFTCWISVRQCRVMNGRYSYDKKNYNFYLFHDSFNMIETKYQDKARPIIEDNYDKIVRCFMDSYMYKHLKPKELVDNDRD